jgi:hypothetical protein
MMHYGQSRPWQDILKESFGEDTINSQPLLDYYKPLEKWLRRQVKLHKIPLGW